MRVVVDTSAVLAVVLNEPEKPLLIAATEGAYFLAPSSLHWEVGNALAAGFKKGRLTLTEAQAALAAYRQIAIHFDDIDLVDAVALAHRLNIYAYDAYVLACAKKHRCPILTLDKGLKDAAERDHIKRVEI